MNALQRNKIKPKKSFGNKKRIYTITKYIAPYTLQIDKKNELKSSVIGFVNKSDAIRFAYLLEKFHEYNYIWPLFNLDKNNISNFIIFTNFQYVNESDLNILDIDSWEFDSIVNYCKYNVFDLALLNEKEDNYNKHHNITYNAKLYNINSSIEDQINICDTMYNY